MEYSKKKADSLKKQHWSDLPERGATFGIWIFLWVYRILGRKLAEGILFFAIGYFFLTGRCARNASMKYLTRVFKYGTDHPKLQQKPTWKSVYFHFLTFGRAALDKISSWIGQISVEKIDFNNKKQFIERAKTGKGGIIIGSHLGNIEVLRALVHEIKVVKINVLVFTKHALKFNTILNQLNPTVTQRMIHVETIGPETAIYLKEKIEQGEFIVVVSDRTAILSKDHVSYVDFLGEKAPFSQGPLILAKILECPVYLLFCLKQKNRFIANFELFLEEVKVARKEKQVVYQEIIQKYARRLEYYCLQEPFQWFNFFDFWIHNLPQDLKHRQNK